MWEGLQSCWKSESTLFNHISPLLPQHKSPICTYQQKEGKGGEGGLLIITLLSFPLFKGERIKRRRLKWKIEQTWKNLRAKGRTEGILSVLPRLSSRGRERRVRKTVSGWLDLQHLSRHEKDPTRPMDYGYLVLKNLNSPWNAFQIFTQ